MAGPRFGPFAVAEQIFFRSKLSHGIVNLKPIVPGHVLVAPHRVTPRLQDLTTEEVCDLFLSVQQIGNVVEKVYNGGSLTVAVQDGPLAGQSVPHVHVHVLPRVKKDFEPLDKMYEALEGANVGQDQYNSEVGLGRRKGTMVPVDADSDRKPRSMEEMIIEARMLEKHFPEENRPQYEQEPSPPPSS